MTTKSLRACATSFLLLLPAVACVYSLPTAAIAQPAAPEVRSLEMDADAGLEPGSRLRIKLTGTPRAKASVRVRGVRQPILLREVSPGIYVGRYTLKRTDRVEPDAGLRAALRQGNRTTLSEHGLQDLLAPPPAVAVAPQRPPRPADPVRIDRFAMTPVERIEPGVELQFAVEGGPGATVSVDLPGVERDVRLRETRAGHYEGAYTVRRSDQIALDRPAIATLRLGDREVKTQLGIVAARPGAQARQPGPDTRAPELAQLAPPEGAVVAPGQPVVVSARFDDGRGTGVDPASVRVSISGRNVTQDAQISAGAFSVRAALPPGRHTVEVIARDVAGNAVRKGWSFDVAAAAPVNVPLRVLNFRNNDQVGAGATQVQGHTLPAATVQVRVVATPPANMPINISQELLTQTLQADQNGNFNFSFTPQIPIPGARYEISITSSRGSNRDEERLTLVQR